MHANNMLEYGDKIIEAFKDGAFLSEHLKNWDAAAYDYVLKDVNNFIQKIESVSENIKFIKWVFWIITSWLCKRAYQC